MSFAPVSVCQRFNVVRSVFCHPQVSFLVKPLFTTVNLAHPVTVYIVKSVNLAHHIRQVCPCVHCTKVSIGTFLISGRENVTSFPLPSLN